MINFAYRGLVETEEIEPLRGSEKDRLKGLAYKLLFWGIGNENLLLQTVECNLERSKAADLEQGLGNTWISKEILVIQ